MTQSTVSLGCGGSGEMGGGVGSLCWDPEDRCMSSELGRSAPLVSRGLWEAGDVGVVVAWSAAVGTSELEESSESPHGRELGGSVGGERG